MSSHDDALAFITSATLERFQLDPARTEIEIRDLALLPEAGGFTVWAGIRAATDGRPFPINRAIRARVYQAGEPSVIWFQIDLGDD